MKETIGGCEGCHVPMKSASGLSSDHRCRQPVLIRFDRSYKFKDIRRVIENQTDSVIVNVFLSCCCSRVIKCFVTCICLLFFLLPVVSFAMSS